MFAIVNYLIREYVLLFLWLVHIHTYGVHLDSLESAISFTLVISSVHSLTGGWLALRRIPLAFIGGVIVTRIANNYIRRRWKNQGRSRLSFISPRFTQKTCGILWRVMFRFQRRHWVVCRVPGRTAAVNRRCSLLDYCVASGINCV